MVDLGLRPNFMAPASELMLTNPEEVQEAIRGLKVNKAPGPNGIPNRALKHLPQRAVISILKPGKDPARPSSYRLISLLDTIKII